MRAFLLVVLLVLTNLANAQVLAEKPGQVSLRVEVTRKVSHDLMRVNLFIQEQGKDPVKLSKIVTERLNKAITKARSVGDKVNIQIGWRRTNPIYKPKDYEQITGWDERASIYLESKDFLVLSNLISELAGDLKFANLEFLISNELKLKLEEELSQEVAKKFMVRAKTIAGALGAKKFELVSLDLTNSGNNYYQPVVPQRMVMSSDSRQSKEYMPQMVTESGSTQFMFTAEGRIILSF